MGATPNPDKPELKIEELWYRFALSFLSKCDSIPKIFNLAKELGIQGCHTLKDMILTPIQSV